MHGNLLVLLLLAFVGLTGLGFTGLLVVNGQARQEKIRQRFEAATAPHMRIRRVEAPRLVRNKPAAKPDSLIERAASLFGFNVAQSEQYPVKWWVLLLTTLVAARLLAGLLVELLGPIAWVSLPAVWVLSSRAIFNMMMLRRRQKLYAQFPDCLAMIVRSVRAGVPLTEAIRIVARESQQPSAGEFGRVAGDLSIGTPIADALKSMADRNDITEFRFFATALTLQSQTGGRLGETLDNLANIVRKRMALKSRGRALASEARTTAMILGGLPVLAMGGLYLINPAYMGVLFFDPTGRLILASAFTSLGIGAFIMRTIIEKSLA
ncbi:type II secretion system F family protein [Limobrevibacterium gyesilva]|uniref:Type II secretion system F family protein n=1 Tax=Limobrevibacterium gyesilva TaxID=2991712 RepID=A0AA41YSL1_9PROT|nr:type II secretion system F family protein [Limobrevibacterium gyesilva]MCW3475823.1 type II secretion system F family protein [Limobrevibacterium gyesilva]